jgi:hypothetical protein
VLASYLSYISFDSYRRQWIKQTNKAGTLKIAAAMAKIVVFIADIQTSPFCKG